MAIMSVFAMPLKHTAWIRMASLTGSNLRFMAPNSFMTSALAQVIGKAHAPLLPATFASLNPHNGRLLHSPRSAAAGPKSQLN